ncbi:TetR/AcrR family transcriptional regulator [Mycolicibacterium sp.]|uniref:TetR/AcrR family transcriptional regulator n=1 Tax=Mycolicibacterium sp. TaxID=2320850 RepID=UPI0025CC90B0|nr:TetR/AcrR family transcriptional regulator [Mycolicibacterium sp.]
MDTVDGFGQLPVDAPHERGDAARNRRLLLDAARTLMAQRSPEEISTDDIVAAAGVGKGTLFRRFGSRAGLMVELLDEDERAMQQAFMFGPPPLGPQAAPLQRLVAFGRERLRFVHTHRAVLAEINRDPDARYNAVFAVLHTHVRVLLAAAGTTGDLDAQADALLALLDADYVTHQIDGRGRTLDELAGAWDSLAHKLCGN